MEKDDEGWSDRTTNESERALLFDSHATEAVGPDGRSQRQQRHKRRFLTLIIGLLVVSNLVFATLSAVYGLRLHNKHISPVPWLPPEIPRTQQFQYQAIFGGHLTSESEEAWTKLIPKGKGFVHIDNKTALAPMPGLNQSLPEQRAMIAVFHQLHCLYITRQSFFKARAGNFDEIRTEHLSHCWDYLRQTVMCGADTTLEWVGAPPMDTGSTGWGYQHKCRDYGAIFAWAERHRLTDTKKIHS